MNAIYEEVRIALHLVWRRRWLALAVAWVVCLFGWLVVSLIPNRYESRAHISLEMQSLLPGKVGIDENDAQKTIDRVRQTLTSNENLIKVVRATDIGRKAANDAGVAVLAGQLREGISVVALPDNFFEISAEASIGGLSDAANAKLAHDVVARLIDSFVARNLADDRAETAQTLTFLNGELQRREKGLSEAEGRRAAFEQKYLGSLPGTGSIEQRIESVRTELAGLDSTFASAQSGLAALNAQMASTPATVAGAGGAGGGGRLAGLEGQLADAQAKGWTDQHPDVVAIRSQMARLRASGGGGAAAVSGTSNPLYVTIRSMQAEKQAAAASIGSRKAQLEGDLARFMAIQVGQPGIAAEQARLNHDYEALKDQYDKLLADREDVRLRSDVANRTDSVRFQVIDPPTMPRLPASPNRPLLLFAVLIVGLGAGTGAAFVQGQLKTSYPTADRLSKATGMIVLGSIPETLTAAMSVDRAQKLKWFAGGAGALAGAFVLLLAIEFIERGLMA